MTYALGWYRNLPQGEFEPPTDLDDTNMFSPDFAPHSGDPGSNIADYYAGINGLVGGEVVVWSTIWTPTVSDPAPFITYPLGENAGPIRFHPGTSDADPYPQIAGTLVLDATVDGVQLDGHLRIVWTIGGEYGTYAYEFLPGIIHGTETKADYIVVTAPAPPPPESDSMNVLPISRLIAVSANLTPAGAAAQSLHTLLILGNSPVIDTTQMLRNYTALTQVAADFGSTAPEYLAAALWFEQVPQPSTLSIGRMVSSPSKGGLVGAFRSAAQQAIAAWQAITNGGFSYTRDGGSPTAVTGLNFSGAANLNAVAALITAGMTGVTCAWDAVNSHFVFTSGTTGVTSAVGFLTAGSGTDISGMVGGRTIDSGAYLFTGQAAQTAIQAVQAFDLAFGRKWYGCVCLPAVNADHLAIAAYLEGTNTKHLYGVTTQEGATLVTGDTTSIAYQLQQFAYKKTLTQYSSSNSAAVVSALARQLTVDYTGQNTVITLAYKTEPGIAPENLNEQQAQALESVNCNYYAAYDNDTAIIFPGKTASGIFIDTVVGTDSMVLDLQIDLWNLAYTTTTKIPQTNGGTHTMVTVCENRLAEYVGDGFLAPGVWNATGFGTLKTGDYLPKGFYVFAPNVDDQPEADRSDRKSVPLQIAAKTAGAVHYITVDMTINQ